MSKHSPSTLPPLPQKRKPIPADKIRSTRQDWEKYINMQVRSYTKTENKLNNPGLIELFDLSGEMLSRRKRVMLDTLPQVQSRYSEFQSTNPNFIGSRWIDLNTSFFSYSLIESQSHILLAASIWVLDHVEVDKVFPFLPTKDELSDEYFILDLWDPQYSDELLASVQYVLANRNGAPAVTKNGYKKVLTDEATAANRHHTESQGRNAFDSIISMIPQKDVDHAIKAFEDLLWKWVDKFYSGLFPLQNDLDGLLQKYEEECAKYNAICDQIADRVSELERYRKSRKEAVKRKPAIAPVIPQMQIPIPSLESSSRISSALLSRDMELDTITARLFSLFKDLEQMDEAADSVLDEIDNASDAMTKYIVGALRGTTSEQSYAEPLPIKDAYELCFALLYLIDTGNDLPWIYGAGVGLMQEVTECLPWGIIEYRDEDDAFWNEFKYKGKKVPIPDWNERKYQRKDDLFVRSMNQLLYEETGCIMPRNLHIYDRRSKALSKYGVSDKELVYMLSIMTTMAYARRQRVALNLEEDYDDDYTRVPDKKDDDDSTSMYREEIKRLRSALHDAEKEARDARKALEDSKTQALVEHRELSDLRELVFRQGEDNQSDEEESAENESVFPYTVQKTTLVFGGHDTWIKAIKKLLTGNIRFVSKDYVFDTSIIRHVDVVWIQHNAISHKQYYRIADTARLYKIPIRYFLYASARKGASQLMEYDS